ncbi:hypothetical protein MCOR02_008186 [Pyricularia oryzae]|uniref:SNF2-family ATP dependent chromatin remodeling factor snf21 n=5 Tax=Pyricularia TaxID=48558 RepID=A0ABQ8N632_PYRGI|nr:SNF2 family ATP-dependent chromatin-remodeling factor snf21 [Pyricularia oryzae 70-15]ELQ44375.1 SNF2 family ATP-dependent chromatin-remodeling factor snf21 [Pyricularia oryzae Y34]KAH8843390.1 hypothetical protein MCOR01_004206 [Pyricularia oryzae]KAI6291890.1 hypothetical protein MCOR33_010265 [Pyricularia grisea]EHA50866.1 SNF2 family ATP-dependent chromatin-remodeling factor snf21 [Pyricularia oryzae 70-15]KAH9430860.1 hypothetical protein MCOR02_008186 [Pyricularia oryzae]
MASVQTMPAAQQQSQQGQQPVPQQAQIPGQQPQHQGTAMPASLGQQQLSEMLFRYQQLKKQGVPPNNPEFARLSQILHNFQQQQKMRKQAQQQQQHQQQMQMQHSATNGSSIGAPSEATHEQAPPKANQPQPSSASDSGHPTPSNNAAAPITSASPSAAPRSSGAFTPQQLKLLRTQFKTFGFLRKNAGVPLHLQQVIAAARKQRQAAIAEQHAGATPTAGAKVSPGTVVPPALPNGADASQSPAVEEPKQPGFTSFKDPYTEGVIRKSISYFEHGQRSNRPFVPGIMPIGIDFEQLRSDRETIILNRMSARYNELQKLAGNMAHWDTAQDEVVPDESLKRKAIIEMMKIQLYSKQRAFREKAGRLMINYDNLAMTTNRSHYRRMKKQNVREARITEKLEKDQRNAREIRERKKHTDFLQAVFTHRNEMHASAQAQQSKMSRLGRWMTNHHSNIEKEEQKRIERNAKQRLQALKANDEEAYLKLLDQAKDTRITHLLRQTDGFLHQLTASVKAQQRQAAERYGGEEIIDDEELPDSDDEESNRKIDYYAVAHRIKEEVTAQASILVGGTLKEYQIKGLQWMISLYNNNLNGILADEMGLGKTIQTISLITYLIEKKQQHGPYLVIVPLSTLTNWTLEFEKWAPSVTRVVYKGPPNARKQQQDKIRQGRFQVLLTTYEYIIKDRPILSKIKWFHMIIDEGHRMKNSNSKLTSTIQQYYQTRFRLILTGTPLQNNLAELWAMLNFTLPNIFKSAKTFDEWFNTPFANTGGQDKMELTEEEQILVIRRLHKVLRPFLLRRLKKDVEKDLPDKTEKVIKCKFSALQSRLYNQMVKHQKLVVSDGKGGKTGARGLSNMIMQLRKLCNHPFVFDEVENQMNPTNTSNDLLWRTAGKFELLDRVLPKYKASGHRVLMFFQMTAIMDIMEDFLRFRGIQYLRLDGTTKSEDRSDLLYQFNRPDSPYFMFLLSTRAGGLGLNLQTADTVIIYDSDWNPHQDLQAQDRAHRIGQKNEVRILRLISSSSVEEKILDRARFKLDMDGKIIQAGRFDNKSSETDRDAMLRTLLETADMAENGEQEEMDDEELNMILARNEAELAIFQEMDEQRSKDPIYGTAAGCKGVPRLMAETELPEIYLGDGNPVEEEQETILGRGARERTKVKYDDGLTEEQWLMAVDDDDDSPEAAAARKQARKDKRETNRLKRLAAGIASPENSPTASRASTEEPQIETPVKKRGRKPGSKNVEKRKAEDGDDEPPAKKRRGPQGRPKAVKTGSPHRALLQKSLGNLYEALMELEVDDIDPEAKDEDDEPLKRLIIGPFIKLPPKRDFPDYYQFIAKPIAMKQIETRIKKEEYSNLSDLKSDIELLCNNCRQYNEDGSILYSDANIIEKFFNERLEAELSSHPELQELEVGSSKDHDTSVAPSTATGTPQPAAATATRIKIVTNGTNQPNGTTNGNAGEEE